MPVRDRRDRVRLTLCPFRAYSVHSLNHTSYADTHRQYLSAIPANIR